MEETKNFIKGMHSDFDPQNQPEGTYRTAHNWVREFDGSLKSELGTISVADIPETKSVIGTYLLGDTVVLFLYDLFDNHEVGYLKNSVYTSVIKSSTLKFSIYNLVKCRGRVDYRGHRLIYFVDGVNPLRAVDLDKDYSSVTDIEGEIKLQIDSTLPEVALASIDDSGDLPTGIYQFQARLLTASVNKGIPGLMTNPIPVIDDISSTPDGAAPQSKSTKRINIQISNIDTKFKFVEILAISYEGIANMPKVSIVGRKKITGPTLTFSYYSTSQILEETTVDDITIEPTIYTSGKFIDYKDGHLLVAGLKTKARSSSFQKVANNIKVEYTIQSLIFNEDTGLTTGNNKEFSRADYFVPESGFRSHTYHIPVNTVNYKSLRRDEVYSISITPAYIDGTTGSAYHIPAPYVNANRINPAVPYILGSGKTGTYLSDEVYPSGFDYPTGKVRHHIMPSNLQEPSVTSGYVRVLGLKLSNIDISVLSSEEQKEISGYIIGYQRRTKLNKSILTQGIVQPLGRRKSNGECFISPFHGKGSYRYKMGYSGNAYTVIDEDWISSTGTGTSDNALYYNDAMVFYSPETIIAGDIPLGDRLERIGSTKGKSFLVSSELASGGGGKYANMFMDFTSVTYESPQTSVILTDTMYPIPAENSLGYITPPNFKIAGKSISTKKVNGGLFFHTSGAVPLWNNSYSKDKSNGVCEMAYEEKSGTDSLFFVRNGIRYADSSSTSPFYADASRAIFNIKATRNSQYGQVESAEYVYMAHSLNKSQKDITIFNGDTFINKVGIMSTTAVPNDDKTVDKSFKTLTYVFLESDINTAYRHYTVANGEEKGTVPYFPKYKTLWSKEGQNGLFQIDPKLGHATGYNTQYSFDNGLKKYFPVPLLMEEEVTEYPNRCIYSEIAMEGEQFDANRLFLPNNYQDMPKHRGKITDMFVHSGDLYFHTPQTLFKSSFNQQVTQVTSAGEVTLGNGGAFSRPPIELFTLTGGYAGTCSASGINTPIGRIFIDEIQKKVFMFGEGVNEISIDGMSEFFKNNLEVLPEELMNGYVAVYDSLNRRYILSKKKNTLNQELVDELYTGKYKGDFVNTPSFVSTLRSGDIVKVNGIYKRIK